MCFIWGQVFSNLMDFKNSSGTNLPLSPIILIFGLSSFQYKTLIHSKAVKAFLTNIESLQIFFGLVF